MEIKIEGNNQLHKLALLITEAGRLGFNLSGYGYAAENENSGNVYIWLEDEPYCIFIGPCDGTIYACWSNPENGDEFEPRPPARMRTIWSNGFASANPESAPTKGTES